MELGKLYKTEPRQIWKTEPEFTEWLSKHVDLLSKELGLELDVMELEAPIGDFSADILAKDLISGKYVIIENQLEQTNHEHLGKILTYAAGKDANIIVWISPKFREEHQSALNWLNEKTIEDVSIFGIEIELLKIDESKPAPQFKIVSRPDIWEKSIRTRPKVSEKMLAYQDFFQILIDKLRYQGLTSAKKAQQQSWIDIGAGRSGFGYGFSFMRKGYGIELFIDTGDAERNEKAYDALLEDKVDIEKEIGIPLSWERLEDRRVCRIRVYYNEPLDILDVKRRNIQDELINWSIETVKKFKKSFFHRIKKVKLE